MTAAGTGATSVGDLRLEVVSGNAAGFDIVVTDRLVIGRHSEGPGRLADDPELSRHHAEITRDAALGTFTIEDLASTNGTIVNGTRISSPTPLAAGDSIEVGSTTINVVAAPTTPAPAPVDVRAKTVTVDTPAPMRAPAPPPGPPLPPAVDAPPTVAQPPAEPVAEPPETVSEPVAEPPETVTEPPAEPVAEPPAEPPETVAEPPETVAEPVAEPPATVTEGVAEPTAEAVAELIAEPLPDPPAPSPAADPTPSVPPLALQLVVDPERGEAEIRLDEVSPPIRLSLDQGRWQVVDEGS